MLTLYGLGVTVGAGIYVLVGATAAQAGPYAPFSFLIAAMVVAWGFFIADPAGVGLAQMVPPLTGPHWAGIGAASLLAFFAFVGFEDMANVAEEVKDPVHTMPRAILWTLALATVLNVLTTSAVLTSVPMDQLAASAAPLALVFEAAPAGIKTAFAYVAIVATLNGVLIQTIMASRVLYGLANQGHLPAALAQVSARTKTPTLASLVVVAIIAVLALSLPITALAQHTSQIVLTVFVLVNLALIRLKLMVDQPDAYFRVPLLVPVMGVATSVLLFATSFL